MGTKGIRICNLPRPRKIFPNREKQVQSRVVVLKNRIFILLFFSGWKCSFHCLCTLPVVS